MTDGSLQRRVLMLALDHLHRNRDDLWLLFAAGVNPNSASQGRTRNHPFNSYAGTLCGINAI
jgi:hypothetical protein